MKYIYVKDLEKIFGLIIKKLNFEGFEKIEINSDFYNYIPTDKWDSFENDIFETGSLLDDLESLERLANNPDRPCTYVDFDRVAAILRAISEKNNPVRENDLPDQMH
jgi:hypothetical protein